MKPVHAWALGCCVAFWVGAASTLHAQFIYVANTAEATVSKIDIKTNTEVARYRTWFGPAGDPKPSRIAVDAAGDVYVLNRFWTAGNPVLVKILRTGGVTTSTGPAPLPLPDLPPIGKLDQVDLSAPGTDDRIAWAMEIVDPSTLNPKRGRALCFDLNGFLWVGIWDRNRYYKIDPLTQTVVGPAIDTKMTINNQLVTHFPYGCVVDDKGRLWSASSQSNVAQIDTRPQSQGGHKLVNILTHTSNNYGITALYGCGRKPSKIYFSDWGTGKKAYIALDPDTGAFTYGPSLSTPQQSFAVAVDLQGNLLSAGKNGTLAKFDTTTGIKLWEVPPPALYPTTDLHGLIIDAHNEIWAVDRANDRVLKYKSDGTFVTKVDVGDEPYTYSNARPPNCPCAEAGKASLSCKGENGGIGTFDWSFTLTNYSPFSGPAATVGISSSSPGMTIVTPASPYTLPAPLPGNGQATISGTMTIVNPQPGSHVCAEIQLLGAGENHWCCPPENVCFPVPECRKCIQASAKLECGSDGKLYLYLTVTNSGPTTAPSVQVFSNTPGVTVTPSSMQWQLPAGVATTLPPFVVSGASPSQSIGLTVNVHGPVNPETGAYSWCCTATTTVVSPKLFCISISDPTAATPTNPSR